MDTPLVLTIIFTLCICLRSCTVVDKLLSLVGTITFPGEGTLMNRMWIEMNVSRVHRQAAVFFFSTGIKPSEICKDSLRAESLTSVAGQSPSCEVSHCHMCLRECWEVLLGLVWIGDARGLTARQCWLRVIIWKLRLSARSSQEPPPSAFWGWERQWVKGHSSCSLAKGLHTHLSLLLQSCLSCLGSRHGSPGVSCEISTSPPALKASAQSSSRGRF